MAPPTKDADTSNVLGWPAPAHGRPGFLSERPFAFYSHQTTKYISPLKRKAASQAVGSWPNRDSATSLAMLLKMNGKETQTG